MQGSGAGGQINSVRKRNVCEMRTKFTHLTPQNLSAKGPVRGHTRFFSLRASNQAGFSLGPPGYRGERAETAGKRPRFDPAHPWRASSAGRSQLCHRGSPHVDWEAEVVEARRGAQQEAEEEGKGVGVELLGGLGLGPQRQRRLSGLRQAGATSSKVRWRPGQRARHCGRRHRTQVCVQHSTPWQRRPWRWQGMMGSSSSCLMAAPADASCPQQLPHGSGTACLPLSSRRSPSSP